MTIENYRNILYTLLGAGRWKSAEYWSWLIRIYWKNYGAKYWSSGKCCMPEIPQKNIYIGELLAEIVAVVLELLVPSDVSNKK